MVTTIVKKIKEITLEVIGGNSEGVTGSCTKIEFLGRTILFELGMIQDCNTILENYKANCAIFNKIKSKSIDMVIVGHFHCDHILYFRCSIQEGQMQLLLSQKTVHQLLEKCGTIALISTKEM